MTNPSPLVLINSQSQLPNGVNVTDGSTVTIALASSNGVYSWNVECIGTDDSNSASAVNATLVINSAAQTATFTAPNTDGYGAALIFRSQVNNGIDINGLVQPYLTTTFGIYITVGSSGLRVGGQNETVEGNSTFGWLTKFNEAIRSSGGSVSLNGDVSGSSNANTVLGIDGHALPSLSDGYLNWTGSAWQYSAITIPTSLPPNGSAGGDLSGTYPNPTISGLAVSKLASGTANQVLINNATPSPAWTTLSGDVTNSLGAMTVGGIQGKSLPTLPVSNGYLNYTGSAWQYSAITIPTTLPPTGAAGGDLGGTYPNPAVASLTGNSGTVSSAAKQITFNNNLLGGIALDVASMASTSSGSGSVGQDIYLIGQPGQNATGASHNGGNGGNAHITSGIGGTSGSASPGTSGSVILSIGGSSASGSGTPGLTLNPTGVVTIANLGVGLVHADSSGNLTSSTLVNADVSATAAVAVSKLAAGTANQVLINNATPSPAWTTLSGDVTNSLGAMSVGGIQGKSLPTLPVSDGYLNYTGSAWQYSAITIPTSLPPSGTAGGALSGTYPNPTISLTSNSSITGLLPVANIAPGTSAQLLLSNGTPVTTWTSLSGDSTLSSTGVITNIGIDGYTIISPGPLSGQVLEYNGTNLVWITPSSGVTWSNDLAGSTNTQQYVAAISGNAGAGGSIPINATTLSFGATQTTPTITQAITSGTPNTLLVEAQSTSQVSTYGANLLLKSGTGPAGAGAVMLESYSNSDYVALEPGATNSIQMLSAGSTKITSGANVVMNITGNYQVNIGGTTELVVSSSQVLVENVDFVTGSGVRFLSMGTGILHSNSIGGISSSLILDADISSSAAVAVSKLAAGSANQVLINNATPTPAWTTLSGDVTNSLGVMTVGGIDGYVIASPGPVSGQVLEYNGSNLVWSAVAAVVTWADDLVGSTNSAQYVAAISGNAGAGGSIPINATTLAFANGQASPTINQSALAATNTPAAGQNMSVIAQTGTAGLSGNNNGGAGGNLILQVGQGGAASGSGTNGANGYLDFIGATVYQTYSPPSTSTYKIGQNNEHHIFCKTSTVGAITLTLPSPVAGLTYEIWDTEGLANTNKITVQQNSSEKIAGLAASYVLQANWGHITITSNGTDWFIG